MWVTSLVMLTAMGAELLGEHPGVEVTYNGRFAPIKVSDESAASKGFSVTWFVSRDTAGDERTLFMTTEDASALPWPARFGIDSLQESDANQRIGYRFGNHESTVPLPSLVFPHLQAIGEEGEVTAGRWQWRAVDEQTIDGTECLVLEGRTAFGHERKIVVERDSGLLIRHVETVTLGRGDRFELSLELSERTPLDQSQVERHLELIEQFRRVADTIEQGERDPGRDLTYEQLDAAQEAAAKLIKAGKGTAFARLTEDIVRDLREQSARATGIEQLEAKIVGSPAPPLELIGLESGSPLPALEKASVVVLHFWEYDHDTLAAPYGQVGYLDFLHRKRLGDGVAVVGVAVNPSFDDPQARSLAVRSAKKLVEFMNVEYSIATDDGTFLKKFGDPRSLGAPLPLWVVIDAEGVIRRYKSGLFEVEANKGLTELDDLVTRLAKDAVRTE